MKRIYSALLLICVCTFSYGQTEFDYSRDFDAILKATKDSSSTLYYPKLLQKFSVNDSTLTNKEVLSMMIGFTENENYKPYQTIDLEREILNLISDKKYDRALEKCNKLLETNPFNYPALMEKGFALWKLKDENFEFYKSQYFKVLEAILYSGDGSQQNAFFVLSPIDGQTIIEYVWQGSIGVMGSGSDENGNFLDILEMQKKGEESVTVYFNIQHAMNKSEMKKQIDEAIKKNK
jgi:hypothetical protein